MDGLTREASRVYRFLRSHPRFMVQVIYPKEEHSQTKKSLLLFNEFSISKLRYFTIDNTILVHFDNNSVLSCCASIINK